jgi:uncharacterized membrane protein
MNAYHVMLVHFPIALWTTAALVVALRAFSSGPLALSADRVLAALLAFGTLTGALGFAVGLAVWPIDAVTSSPLARNHVLFGSWAVGAWLVLTLVRWFGGEGVWQGAWRWVMLGLAGLGMALQTITGTLGGYLAGNPSAVSQILRTFGWEVFTTFYVPTWALVTALAATVALIALGIMGRRGQGSTLGAVRPGGIPLEAREATT